MLQVDRFPHKTAIVRKHPESSVPDWTMGERLTARWLLFCALGIILLHQE